MEKCLGRCTTKKISLYPIAGDLSRCIISARGYGQSPIVKPLLPVMSVSDFSWARASKTSLLGKRPMSSPRAFTVSIELIFREQPD